MLRATHVNLVFALLILDALAGGASGSRGSTLLLVSVLRAALIQYLLVGMLNVKVTVSRIRAEIGPNS